MLLLQYYVDLMGRDFQFKEEDVLLNDDETIEEAVLLRIYKSVSFKFLISSSIIFTNILHLDREETGRWKLEKDTRLSTNVLQQSFRSRRAR